MNRKIAAATVSMSLLVGACATGTYYPPATEDKVTARNEQVVSKPFDEVWTKLIDYASSNFFSIDNFEKASGLITLSFGSGEPAKFIDCGRITAEGMGRTLNEPYAAYLTNQHRATLSGKMNIVVRPIDSKTTQVKVNARYIFTAPQKAQVPASNWVFDSGGEATVTVHNAIANTIPTRTCRPTHTAERAILHAIAE